MSELLYRTGRMLFYAYLRIINNLQFHGISNVPPGPVVLAANHASYMDPVLVSIALKQSDRRVRWMAWDVLFRIPVLGFLIKKLGAFPVKPDKADRKSLGEAEKILRRGGVLGIFPEGVRTTDGSYQAAKPGFARLAIKTGAAVVPVVIKGSYKAWPPCRLLPGRGRITVYFLEPVYTESYERSREGEYELVRQFEEIRKRESG